MALSRMALSLALLLAPAPAAGQAIIAAPPDPLGDIARRQALEGRGFLAADPGCVGGSEAEIVVCGRRSEDYRVPYEPEPGSPPVRAMGELPRPGDLGGECHRMCHQPVGVSINPIRLIRDPVGTLRDMLRGR